MSWMTQTEAAATLGCSIRTIRRRIRAGAMNARRDGRHLMVQVDTDKAMATVTQVGRQLAEVGAAAAIQRKQDTDALATIHSTFKDTLSVLDTYRERAEREVQAYRRSARWGWGIAVVLTIALVASGWLIHSERIARDSKLHEMQSEVQSIRNASDTAIVTAEIRHAGEMTAQQAKYDAATAAMKEALHHERETVASLDQRIADAQQALAERTRELQAAKDARERLARTNDRTRLRLQAALVLSRLKSTIKSIWQDVRSAGGGAGGTRPSDDIRAALNEAAVTYQSDLQRLEHNRKREISQLVDGQSQIVSTLQSALLEKEATQQRLEQRNNELADKLIAAVTERSYLAAEHERLLRENVELRSRLERAALPEEPASADESPKPKHPDTQSHRTYGPTAAPQTNTQYHWQTPRNGSDSHNVN